MWLKVDDSFVEHAKTLAAGAQLEGGHGLGRVVAVWLEAALFCSRRLTNGFIPERVVARLLVDDAPLEVAAALVHVGLWTVVPGGFAFHDWQDYQPDAATVQARRERERARRQAVDGLSEGDLLNQAGAHVADTLHATCTQRVDTLHARCAAPVPQREDQDQKQKSSAALHAIRTRPARMPPRTVWDVETHLLAAVHHTLDTGPPYVDAHGAPVLAELRDELKRIASHDLGADWEGRELDAIVTAALARRAKQQHADRRRRAFRQHEADALTALRKRG